MVEADSNTSIQILVPSLALVDTSVCIVIELIHRLKSKTTTLECHVRGSEEPYMNQSATQNDIMDGRFSDSPVVPGSNPTKMVKISQETTKRLLI